MLPPKHCMQSLKMSSLALDEQALQVLETLAQPLALPLREPFFRSVFNELSQYTPEQIGQFLTWRRT